MARVIDIAARHGKKAAVWNEAAARGEIPRSTVVFGWENVSAARRSALNGYPTVVCPGEYFYFDMKQGPTDPGHNWAGIVTAEKVYSFDLENVSRVRDGATENASEEDLPEVPAGVVSPAGSGLPTSGAIGVEATFFSELGLENGSGGAREGVSGASERAHNRASAGAVGASIGAYSGAGGAAAGATKSVHTSTDDEVRFFGVEAPLFTSVVAGNGDKFIDYQLFPRACALAELAWTPAPLRSWSDFQRRMGYVDAEGRPADPANPIPGTHFERLKQMGISYRAAAPVPDPELRTLDVTPTTSITSRRGPVEGDWYLWTFERPLVCREIHLRTGRGHLQRGGFPRGYVEVSYDGKTFTQVADLHDLKATVRPEKPVRALRVVNLSHGNGESSTEVQPLVVR